MAWRSDLRSLAFSCADSRGLPDSATPSYTDRETYKLLALLCFNVLSNLTLIQTNLSQKLNHRFGQGIRMTLHRVLKFNSVQKY